jgi:hypothetical protein
MKNPSIKTKQAAGSVLLITMVFVLIVAAIMISYLTLVQSSDQTVARAQQWNAALAVAEAGIEEGMAVVNQVPITNTNMGFTISSLSHNLNGGTYYVNGSGNIITSTGIVSAPITGDPIARIVQVNAQRQGLFSKGMISMTFITMNGNDIATDSYNSTNNAQSNNGAWNGYVGTNGDVAAVNGIVNIGNHTIDGNLYLGPNSSFTGGNVLGTTYTDWNSQFPDASLPTTDANGNALPSTWPDAPGTSSSHTITNNGYYTIRDTGDITVAAGVTATLDVQVFSYDLSKTTITIMGGTTNAGTIVMYQEAGNVTLGGSSSGGAYNNPPAIPSNRPRNFTYFGLKDVTSVTLGGATDFVGVIYAPEADVKLNGGGSGVNFIGSIVMKSVTMNGHYNFHYDESLKSYFYGYYVVGSWAEL